MNGIPWYLTVPAVIAALVMAAFIALAIRTWRDAPAVGAQWNAAAEAEKTHSRVREELPR